MKCYNCGTELQEGSGFCYNCGAAQQRHAAPEASEPATTVLTPDMAMGNEPATTVLTPDMAKDYEPATTVLTPEMAMGGEPATTVLTPEMAKDYEPATTVLTPEMANANQNQGQQMPYGTAPYTTNAQTGANFVPPYGNGVNYGQYQNPQYPQYIQKPPAKSNKKLFIILIAVFSCLAVVAVGVLAFLFLGK